MKKSSGKMRENKGKWEKAFISHTQGWESGCVPGHGINLIWYTKTRNKDKNILFMLFSLNCLKEMKANIYHC